MAESAEVIGRTAEEAASALGLKVAAGGTISTVTGALLSMQFWVAVSVLVTVVAGLWSIWKGVIDSRLKREAKILHDKVDQAQLKLIEQRSIQSAEYHSARMRALECGDVKGADSMTEPDDSLFGGFP